MTPPLIFIVIPAWNRKSDTLACLETLRALTYPCYRIVLVDNGSTDGTTLAVREYWPVVELITNTTNQGFARAVNQGLSHAFEHGADMAFLLNNDTLAAPDILEQLLMAYSEAVGILAPKIFYMTEPQRIWSFGGRRHPFTLEKTGDPRGQLDGVTWSRMMECDYLVGCAMLIPRHTWERTGGFDERYFIYYEDMDFSQRVQATGLRLLAVPNAHLWHKVSVSSGGSDSPNERYWMARSSVLFFRKYARRWQWLIVGPYRLGSAVKTTLRLLVRRRFESMRFSLRDGRGRQAVCLHLSQILPIVLSGFVAQIG